MEDLQLFDAHLVEHSDLSVLNSVRVFIAVGDPSALDRREALNIDQNAGPCRTAMWH